MGEYTIKALTGETWEAFATLCAKNNGGGMGNCWFTWFHQEKHSAPGSSTSRTIQETRDDKQHRVETGCAHAALVSDGDMVVSWGIYPQDTPGQWNFFGSAGLRRKCRSHSSNTAWGGSDAQ